MKKLTEKDAIWCKTEKQAIEVVNRLNSNHTEIQIQRIFQDNPKDVCLVLPDKWCVKKYAKKNYTIHKAKDILKKAFKKDVLKRLEKIENVISDNTTISKMESVEPLKFDLPTKELEEKIDKWFLIVDSENREILEDHFNEKLKIGECVISDNYAVFHSVVMVPKYYTEITFDQFKKWVLKEDEKPAIGNTDTILSIREVQVKVSSQEEANECAEIAKATREVIDDIVFTENFNYFRRDFVSNAFQTIDKDLNLKEISLQEFRERFGKKQETEIDWSKAGQLVKSNLTESLIMINGESNYIYFSGTIIEDFNKGNKGKFSNSWAKCNFKLCTEPITLKNE